MTPRRALVTGAGGFVCRHIVDALLAGGWGVVALDRAFDPALRDAWAGHVEIIEGDAGELPQKDVQAIVHGAAVTASSADVGMTPEAYLREHLDSTFSLLERAQQAGVSRVLLLSSDGVYSKTPPGLLDEDTPVQPRGLYSVVKAALEAAAQTLRTDHGRDIVVMRLGSIYGPGELPRPSRPRISRVGRMIEEALTERRVILDTTLRTQSWTYAPDVGAAARALLEVPLLRHALYNVATQEILSPAAIAEAICQVLPDTRIVETTGEASGDLRRHTLSSQRLREDTGFGAWTPFANGVAATIAWQRTQIEVPT